ncbi:MAG TPA: type II toxin-antitoxin system VapC family toxin [Hyphomicrobiales bacterium]|nr:type II toxin-antitoxin system VapC family toxin [Hyphomicrobiales bacterium]
MRIIADTNILVRVVTEDDPAQARRAQAALAGADLVALPLPALCEFVWVLAQGYGIAALEIAEALRRLIDAANVAVDRPAAEAGLAVLEAGGDFADGVIDHTGRWLGGEVFLSFDRKAVRRLAGLGHAAEAP